MTERIRDKIAASKAKGIWMGGTVPLGYDTIEKKLVINDAEAETVRLIFTRYIELGTVRMLMRDLEKRGIVNKRHESSTGRVTGGTARSITSCPTGSISVRSSIKVSSTLAATTRSLSLKHGRRRKRY